MELPFFYRMLLSLANCVEGAMNEEGSFKNYCTYGNCKEMGDLVWEEVVILFLSNGVEVALGFEGSRAQELYVSKKV